MRRFLVSLAICAMAVLTACGTGASPARLMTARAVLTNAPELLEFEPGAVRQELFREVVRTSAGEAGQLARGPVLFPISRGAQLVAAPGLDPRMDLLQAPNAGEPLALSFDGRAEDRWPEDRREALQGLSEREAAELVARSLLTHWALKPAGSIEVDRAAGAPYAAAYVDGILRINPSFLYLVTAAASPSSGPVQP
jgi:hypothetical protein